jgi:hypothetical protein
MADPPSLAARVKARNARLAMTGDPPWSAAVGYRKPEKPLRPRNEPRPWLYQNVLIWNYLTS